MRTRKFVPNVFDPPEFHSVSFLIKGRYSCSPGGCSNFTIFLYELNMGCILPLFLNFMHLLPYINVDTNTLLYTASLAVIAKFAMRVMHRKSPSN